VNVMSKLPKFIVLITLCLALALPVYAEEEPTEPAAPQPAAESIPGLPTLVLLTGLLAVSAVGFFVIARENYRETPDES